MFKLNNLTPFLADSFILSDENAQENIYLVVKATFDSSLSITLAKDQIPIHVHDEYTGDPNSSSLMSVSESHTGKKSSDILVYGSACTPEQRPLSQMDIHLQVGKIKKSAKILGDRYRNSGHLTPEPFITMPLLWEKSYGGKSQNKKSEYFSDNPIGVGRYFDTSEKLPNIIALNEMNGLSSKAIGFGPIPPHWKSRYQYAGTYDEHWYEERAPYLPFDFDSRFFNCAPQDQIYPEYLLGGEPVRLRGFHPDGEVSFSIPVVNIIAKIDVRDHSYNLPFIIETLAIYPNKKAFSLTWRCAIPSPKNMKDIKTITLSLQRENYV